MEPVSMNDGLEGREPIAFGLAAGELAVFVGALMTAYVVLQSGLPGALAWALAVPVALAGATLAWGRIAGRPLADWVVLVVTYMVRTRARRAAGARRLLARARSRIARTAGASGRAEAGAVVIPLGLHRPAVHPAASSPATTAGPHHAHVIVFFSLNGGTGRTTLAVELASLLAARSAAARAAGGSADGVALFDLAKRSPAVALRLGLPLPLARTQPALAPAAGLVRHGNGLLVSAGPFAAGSDAPGAVDQAVSAAAANGCAVVILDIDCDSGAVCRAALERSDRVMVTITGDAGGVIDAYRSTALLRRLGLRDRIDYVVNRCRARLDLTEVMGDLGGRVLAQVPEHPPLAHAALWQRVPCSSAGAPALPLVALAEELAAGTTGAAAATSEGRAG